MPKHHWIQIRMTPELKAAIKGAAQNEGRTVSNWLVYVAALYDEEVARAAGLRP